MDARVTPEDMLDLGVGDAHVLRNAGAVATDDVIRSLALSTRLMGTHQVFVIGHTQCALDGTREEDLRAATHSDRDFGAFDGIDEHVRDQVDKIRFSRDLPVGLEVHGFVYQVENGRLREVM
jgi:carbonic anhydrase